MILLHLRLDSADFFFKLFVHLTYGCRDELALSIFYRADAFNQSRKAVMLRVLSPGSLSAAVFANHRDSLTVLFNVNGVFVSLLVCFAVSALKDALQGF